MISRPRGGLYTLGGRLRELLIPRAQETGTPRLRGKMRRAVVVPAPGELFSEAVFILRDDALRAPGLDQDELLREAARAAEGYTEEVLPARARGGGLYRGGSARKGAARPAPGGGLPPRRGGGAPARLGAGVSVNRRCASREQMV